MPKTEYRLTATGRKALKNIWIIWKLSSARCGPLIDMQQGTSSILHVAIIMDGNGRWASTRGLPRIAGHRTGAEAVRRTVEAAPELGVSVLTLYAFSADNWRRPRAKFRH